MRYGISLIAGGVLALGLCGAGLAAQSGFTDQKGDGFTIEVPARWQVAPKDFLDKVQQSQAGKNAGKMLMLVQGPGEGGMPKVVLMERSDPGATPDNLATMTDNDVKAWCDTVKGNLKKQTGKDLDVSCNKTTIAAGAALFMQMTLPTGGPEMISQTWTIPHKDSSVVASVMFPKADAGTDLPLAKKMIESLKFTK